MEAILDHSGRNCLEKTGRLEELIKLRSQAKDLSDELELFELYKTKIYNNSDRLQRSEDGTIVLIYNECGCDMVKSGEVTDPTICHCIKGYTKATFETLFGREVEVDLQKTILRGDEYCLQIIK